MFDQQAQATIPHVMRSKLRPIRAPRATLSVTRTVRTSSADRPVMFFHFAFSRGDRQFDRNGCIFLREGRGSLAKGSRPSFFRARGNRPPKKVGGVRERIYRGGVNGGIRGGVPLGQIKEDSGGVFRSVKVRRRICLRGNVLAKTTPSGAKYQSSLRHRPY